MNYDESWNCPHKPGEDISWQESDCYWFFDNKARVGGYHRMGQTPNKDGGAGQVMAFFFKEGGQYFRQTTEIPADQCGRGKDCQHIGSHTVKSLGEDQIAFGYEGADCDVNLEFYEQFYIPRNWMNEDDENSAAIEEGFNSDGHLEVAGRVKGRVRIGDEEYEIDALAQRDRSWGNRDWSTARQGRQITGTIGKNLSWTAVVGQMEEGGFVFKVGFVARDGETTDIKDIKVLASVDYDCFTVGQMKVRLLLADGSHVDLTGHSMQGFLTIWQSDTDSMICSHNLVEAEHDGIKGLSNFDCTFRPRKGKYIPTEGDLSLTRLQDGLHDAADYSQLRW